MKALYFLRTILVSIPFEKMESSMNRTEHQDSTSHREYLDDDMEDDEALEHKRAIRRTLEERLEKKRLKQELEDFDGELEGDFDWDRFDS